MTTFAERLTGGPVVKGQWLRYYRDELGFDTTEHERGTKKYRIQCSQCVAVVIDGHPTHQPGCPKSPMQGGE